MTVEFISLYCFLLFALVRIVRAGGYSTYLSDQQRQQLLDLFIREPDLDIEEAMKKVIPN